MSISERAMGFVGKLRFDKGKGTRLSLSVLSVVATVLCPVSVKAVDEVCGTCNLKVSVTGEFVHIKGNTADKIEGVAGDVSAFYEEISGKNFTVAVAGLPAGKYTVVIGSVETTVSGSGQRVFDITSEGVLLADDYDIFVKADGQKKVSYVSGEVEHTDDALRGPLKVEFKAVTNSAKFNTIQVKNAAGEVLVDLAASGLAEVFTGDATKVPDIAEAPFWRDPVRPLEDRINDLIRRMSLAEKVAQLQHEAPAIERLGLVSYNYWNEALHGVANNNIATVFPQSVGMASTWNPALIRKEGNVIGVEGRAKYNDYANQNKGNSKWWTGLTFWTPNINIFRDPRWGRGQETYGEDPYLTAEIGIEFVRGIQGDDPKYMLAMACAKHYAVHSGPEPDRHHFNAVPDERDLYETYLPQFERVVKEGGVAGVMSSYNAVFGVPVSASTLLLDDILRKQWGFKGYVVSDCGAIGDINGQRSHKYVSTPEEAAALAVKAGCDLCCGGDYNALVLSVQKGLVGEKEIDRALYYTLWTRFRMGLFDPADMVPFNKYTIADNDTPANSQVALDVARQSMVLLKNNGILPIDKSKYKKIAVIGPNADSKTMLEGNYHGSSSKPISILAGIRQIAGDGVEIGYAMGSTINTQTRGAAWSGQDNTKSDRSLPELKAEALSLAASSDLIVYVGGITPLQEGEGFDRAAIELSDIQSALVRELFATGKPMVMVNCSGSAVALPWEDENLAAILQAWYPGQNGGQAVAEVLFGEVNPSGHLPLTFYRATTDLPDFRDYSMKNRTYKYFSGKPLYAFGHGLSYTTFAYKNGKLATKSIPADGTVKVSLTVENTGKLAGDDVVQVYYRHVKSKVEQPKQALCGFVRVSLNAGESKDVTLDIPTSRMRYWDVESKSYIVETGEYEILIGAASDDICYTLPVTIAAR